jgi:cyclin-dependent kinase
VVYECLHPQNEALLDAGDLGSELRLIASIFQTLGTPDDETWPEAKSFRDWGKIEFVKYPGKGWEEVMPWAEEDGRGLVGSLVKFESGERMSADEVGCVPRQERWER